MLSPRAFGQLLKQTWTSFFADDTFQEGAALAYYAIFALPALLVLITRTVGVVLGPEAVTGALEVELGKILGTQGAHDVQQMVRKASRDEGVSVAALIGIGTLLVASTGVFVSMQETLNAIWGVRSRPAKAWLKIIIDRARGFGLILSVGFLLLVSLVAQAALGVVGAVFLRFVPQAHYLWLHIVNLGMSIALSTLLFSAVFKVLPDARIRWRDVWVGALVTAVLFAIGKFIIGFYIGRANLDSVYGAAGTVIVLLTWVFYTSQILFFGAIFTRCYAEAYGQGIQPAPHAVRVQVVEVTDGQEVRVRHAAADATPPASIATAVQHAADEKGTKAK